MPSPASRRASSTDRSTESCASPSVNMTSTRSAISGLECSKSIPWLQRRHQRRPALRRDVRVERVEIQRQRRAIDRQRREGCSSCPRTRRDQGGRRRGPARDGALPAAPCPAGSVWHLRPASTERSMARTRLRPRVSVTIRSSPSAAPTARRRRDSPRGRAPAHKTVPPRGRCARFASDHAARPDPRRRATRPLLHGTTDDRCQGPTTIRARRRDHGTRHR